jgi:hypothetical protein
VIGWATTEARVDKLVCFTTFSNYHNQQRTTLPRAARPAIGLGWPNGAATEKHGGGGGGVRRLSGQRDAAVRAVTVVTI